MIDNSAYKLAQQAKDHSDWMSNFEEKRRNEIDQYQKEKSFTDEILALKNRNQELENLLSRPLKQIAQEHPAFKNNYEALINAYKEVQDEILADWILGQKAYKETAMQLGIQLGKTPEEIKKIASQNVNAVLENKTEHGNNASSSKTLSENAAAIIAMRKKDGKM